MLKFFIFYDIKPKNNTESMKNAKTQINLI